MASIYKRSRSYPVPEGAEIIARRRKARPDELRDDPTRKTIIEYFAKWVDVKGQTRKAPLNAAGNRVVIESGNYLIAYWDADGKRQETNSGTPDRDTAQQIAAKLESDAALRKRGIIDPTAERIATEGRRTVAAHVTDFRAFMAAKGNTAAHVHQACRQIERVIADCHAVQANDLTGAAVLGVIGALRDGGTSLRTCNSYLRSIKTFTRWLWREKRTPDDPLAGLSQYNEATDRRHVRRELTPDESAYLLAHVERNGGENYRLSGPVRAMAYRVALGTGFRVKELRTLTPASFDLQADPPTVTVAAAYSKRRRRDVQPIRCDLADLLQSRLADRPRDEPLFRLPHNTSKMFQRDLAAARAAWIAEATTDTERQRRDGSDFLRYADADGRVADFHAQRHTYISGIVATGASVKTAQELARHSTPVLTIGRYSHARLHDLTGALEALPDLRAEPPLDATQAATGTDGKGLTEISLPANRQQLPGKTAQNGAKRGESDPSRNDNAACRKVLVLNTLGDKRQDVAKWSGAGSNRRHTDFQSVALPTELPDRSGPGKSDASSIISGVSTIRKRHSTVICC